MKLKEFQQRANYVVADSDDDLDKALIDAAARLDSQIFVCSRIATLAEILTLVAVSAAGNGYSLKEVMQVAYEDGRLA